MFFALTCRILKVLFDRAFRTDSFFYWLYCTLSVVYKTWNGKHRLVGTREKFAEQHKDSEAAKTMILTRIEYQLPAGLGSELHSSNEFF